jgi:hypothetical protein
MMTLGSQVGCLFSMSKMGRNMITKQNVLLAIVTLLVLGMCALSVSYMYYFTNEKTTVHHFTYEDQPYLGRENAPVRLKVCYCMMFGHP